MAGSECRQLEVALLAGLWAWAVLISRQAWALAPPAVAGRAAALAALLAFCSAYPVRFSIEGKSYSLLVLSWVKPMAFSRYFVVLLPALVPWLSVRAACLPLNGRGRALALVGFALMLGLWWQQAFAALDSKGGSREADQFRAISQLTADQPERYSPRPRLLNLSDRMEVAAGRIQPPVSSWGDDDALRTRLHRDPLPAQIWLAASGPDAVLRRRLKPLGRELEAAGFRCCTLTSAPRFSQVLQCRSAASPSGDP